MVINGFPYFIIQQALLCLGIGYDGLNLDLFSQMIKLQSIIPFEILLLGGSESGVDEGLVFSVR